MNEPQTRTDRIIGRLKKPKFWLDFALLALAIALAIGSVVFSLCPVYEGLSARLIAIAGGCLAVAVLLETRRRAKAAEEAVGQTEKALDQTKESIIQKTFSDAITHLGHESESVILGGIHSLLDLAKKNSDYRLRVFNILCAHIKTTTATEEYQKKHQEHPSTTILILLDLLFIDKEYNIFSAVPTDSLKNGYKANLNGAYLAGSNLGRARLQDSKLAGAQLQRAFLGEAQLQGASLWGAQLQDADLRGAQLQGAFLIDTKLRGVNLCEAQFQDANLTRAQLQGAFLLETKLRGAKLIQTEMQGAYMNQKTELPRKTDMGGSYLGGVSSVLEMPSGLFFPRFQDHFPKFQKRIRDRRGKEAEIDKDVFDKVKDQFLYALQGNCPAIKRPYTEEDADRWIKEYEEALPGKKHKD